jgi:hypothetical protein
MNGIGIRGNPAKLFFINCARKCDKNLKGKNIKRRKG